MLVIPGNTITYFDVDETLVFWNATKEQLDRDGIEIECPSGFICLDGELKQVPPWTAKVLPHKKHIEQLKKHKMRGHTIVVWSAGGYDWAEAAVKILKLEQFVDVVISKPRWAYDDMPADRIITDITWMKDE